MQASHEAVQAETMVGILGEDRKTGSDADVNLLADSVGDAISQLGLLVTTAAIARLAIDLVSDLSTALQ